MEMLALTCPQCGSAAVKLIPERHDLAQCNYCSALFMLPSSSTKEEAKVQEEEEELEEIDMTEVVYPIKPAPPSNPVMPLILSGGAIILSVICGFQGESNAEHIALWGTIFLIGIVGLVVWFNYINDRQKEYENSEEMQQYTKEVKAAVEKSWAQSERRALLAKRAKAKSK